MLFYVLTFKTVSPPPLSNSHLSKTGSFFKNFHRFSLSLVRAQKAFATGTRSRTRGSTTNGYRFGTD